MSSDVPVNRPDIFIVGVMKGGTTVLHEFLCLHPEIFGGTRKEIHYFSLHDMEGPDWYHRHFEGLPPGCHYIDASPTYFDMAMAPAIPKRIDRYNPQARVVMMARDPIERAISHFHHFRKINRIPGLADMTPDDFFGRDFSRAIARTTPLDNCLMQTLEFSCYSRKAANYRTIFGDRFLVVENADLRTAPQDTMARVFRHVGVDPIEHPQFHALKYSGGTSPDDISDRTRARLEAVLGADYRRFRKLSGLTDGQDT